MAIILVKQFKVTTGWQYRVTLQVRLTLQVALGQAKMELLCLSEREVWLNLMCHPVVLAPTSSENSRNLWWFWVHQCSSRLPFHSRSREISGLGLAFLIGSLLFYDTLWDLNFLTTACHFLLSSFISLVDLHLHFTWCLFDILNRLEPPWSGPHLAMWFDITFLDLPTYNNKFTWITVK